LVARGLIRPWRALRHLLIPKTELDRFLRDTVGPLAAGLGFDLVETKGFQPRPGEFEFTDAPATVLPALRLDPGVVIELLLVALSGLSEGRDGDGSSLLPLFPGEVEELEFSGGEDVGLEALANDLASQFDTGIIHP
jgi:hypothetical protein